MINIKETKNDYILGHGTLSTNSINGEYEQYYIGDFETLEDYVFYYANGGEEMEDGQDDPYYSTFRNNKEVIESIKSNGYFLLNRESPYHAYDVSYCNSGDIITEVYVTLLSDEEVKVERLKSYTQEKEELEKTILYNNKRLSEINNEIGKLN